MNVYKATSIDLIEILYLLKVFFQDLNSSSWVHLDVQCGFVADDISNNNIFLLKKEGVALGMVILKPEVVLENEEISWNNASKNPLKVKRLIIHPVWKNSPIVLELLEFLELYGRENGFTSIRIEEFINNQTVIEFINKLQYRETGKILMERKKVPFACFEKIL